MLKNRLIECIESLNVERLESELVRRNYSDHEWLPAVDYAFDLYEKLKNVLAVFQDWRGLDSLEELNRFRCSVSSRVCILDLIAAGVAEDLEVHLQQGINLADRFDLQSIAYKETYYHNLLCFALQCSSEKMVDYLLTDIYFLSVIRLKKYRPNVIALAIKRAMDEAVKVPHHNAVEMLLKQIDHLGDWVHVHELPLYAAVHDKPEIIKRCQDEDPDSLQRTDVCGNTPLHLAAQHRSYRAVLQLLKTESSSITRLNMFGYASFYCAVAGGCPSTVRLFIEKADVLNLPMTKMWEGNGNNWQWTHLACAQGHRNIYDMLVEYGCGPEPKDKWGITPLTYLKAFEEIHCDRSSTQPAEETNSQSGTVTHTIRVTGADDDDTVVYMTSQIAVDKDTVEGAIKDIITSAEKFKWSLNEIATKLLCYLNDIEQYEDDYSDDNFNETAWTLCNNFTGKEDIGWFILKTSSEWKVFSFPRRCTGVSRKVPPEFDEADRRDLDWFWIVRDL